MLHELDKLEVRRIAELAAALRARRDRLLETTREADFGEPGPQRGPRNPLGGMPFDAVLGTTPEFAALRDAITALPREIRETLWGVAETGRGRFATLDWNQAVAEAAAMTDGAIAARLLENPDLHDVLRKGLYELSAASPPGAGA